MKVWSKLKLKEQNYQVNLMAKSLANYLYKDGPINDITSKYNISIHDRKILDQYTTNRIAGILMLYIAKNKDRINDIVNKYATSDDVLVTPELEGYIEK